MKAVEYRVADEQVRARVISLIANLNLAKPWKVTVGPYTKKRSLNQNSLYWAYIENTISIVAKETGNDRDDLHEFFKRKFMAPQVIEIAGETVQRWTTTKLTVPEMTDFINKVYAWVTSELGILLPLPEEIGR